MCSCLRSCLHSCLHCSQRCFLFCPLAVQLDNTHESHKKSTMLEHLCGSLLNEPYKCSSFLDFYEVHECCPIDLVFMSSCLFVSCLLLCLVCALVCVLVCALVCALVCVLAPPTLSCFRRYLCGCVWAYLLIHTPTDIFEMMIVWWGQSKM